MTKSVSQPALMEPVSSGISGKEMGWYCKVLKVLVVSALGHCVLFGTPHGEKEGEKSLRERSVSQERWNLPTLETFQSSLDKRWSRIVLLYQILFSPGDGAGDDQSWGFDLIAFSCSGVFCRRFTRKQMILANTLFKCVCYHPEEYQLITSGTDRRVSKTRGILLVVIAEHNVWLWTLHNHTRLSSDQAVPAREAFLGKLLYFCRCL